MHLVASAAVMISAAMLSSCNTPTGTGAAAGAATGAVVGGPVGAAVGAATGAIVGTAVGASEVRTYGPAPAKGWPLAAPAGQPGFYRSPYTGKLYDLRGVPHGGLVRDQDTGRLFKKP